MRVIQLMTTISFGDAVSNDALAISRIIADMGYETNIYVEHIDERLPKDTAVNVSKMPKLYKEDVIIYHAATATNLNFALPNYNAKKIMIFHNITPPDFFKQYSVSLKRSANDGLNEMRYLADKVDYCLADSNENRNVLINMGYKCRIDVCPILIPFDDYVEKPSEQVLSQYDDGKTNILFVGRIAPNKKHEDVIRAFYHYNERHNRNSRLFLVGSWSGMESYYNRLRDYIQALGASNIIFTGHIKFNELLAYYKLADVFLCMSEHEGFCVPLVESMFFDVPIVAYASTAIPDTLGGSGILLKDKDPAFCAAVIDRVITDDALREYIISRQRARLADFAYDNVKKQFESYLRLFIAGESTCSL